MKTLFGIAILLCGSLLSVNGQGTFIYDQQSGVEGAGTETGVIIQTHQPVGQSFTPTLSSISFIRVELGDPQTGNSLGATLHLNLYSDSITGTLLGSTDPVSMPDGFGTGSAHGYVNFFFSTPVSLTAGVTYYFQPVVESGDTWDMIGDAGLHYAGGTPYVNGTPSNNFDFWFREGIIVVPEPSSAALLLLGGGAWFIARRKQLPKQ